VQTIIRLFDDLRFYSTTISLSDKGGITSADHYRFEAPFEKSGRWKDMMIQLDIFTFD
jgi:hypothetical protein